MFDTQSRWLSDAVGKAVSPGAEQHRADHHQRHIGEDRDEKAMGACQPMASLRQISISRSAQEMKAPTAQMVTSCQSPPSRKRREAETVFQRAADRR